MEGEKMILILTIVLIIFIIYTQIYLSVLSSHAQKNGALLANLIKQLIKNQNNQNRKDTIEKIKNNFE
jgi:hypothetical protein